MNREVLYEINTRLLLNRLSVDTIGKIPREYFVTLAEKGITIVWMMGVWENCADLIDKCCFSSELISSYSRALHDWEKKDIVGSPYAIKDYTVHPALGTYDELMALKQTLNSLELKLFLDFIPNHLCASTPLLTEYPDAFVQGDEQMLARDPHTYFKNGDKVFAHGRDPMFPAWTDTAQVNYFSETAVNLMIDRLLKLSECCDGIRCDMAMLSLTNVFQNTWMGALKENALPRTEFWSTAIKRVKEKNPGFIFLAEAYWDLEYKLQKLGFDYTYDKRMMERLHGNDIWGVKAHLTADDDFQEKSVRFIENHDEPRSINKFGEARALAAAAAVSTVKGMKFYFDGQFEGKKIKLPVQLGREPKEKASKAVGEFYSKLLNIISDDVFKKGKWTLIEPERIAPDNYSFERFLCWYWEYEHNYRLIVINYSDKTAQCRLKFPFNVPHDIILLEDLLTGAEYLRSTAEIKQLGLYIELRAYQSHIFSFNLK